MDIKSRPVILCDDRKQSTGIQMHVRTDQPVGTVRPNQNDYSGRNYAQPKNLFISDPTVKPGIFHAQRKQGHGRIAIGKVLDVCPKQFCGKIRAQHFKSVP